MILIIEEEQMADRLTIFRISLAFTDRTLSVLQLGYKSENSNDSSLSIFQTHYIYIYMYTTIEHMLYAEVSNKLISPSFAILRIESLILHDSSHPLRFWITAYWFNLPILIDFNVP